MLGNSSSDPLPRGNLNADGIYYDETTRIHFQSREGAIANGMGVTVAISDNTYDRIIFNQPARNNYLGAGNMADVEKGQSDHYHIFDHFDPLAP